MDEGYDRRIESDDGDQVEDRPLKINPSQLSDEALLGVIDNFIVRDGTDYGAEEVAYEKKVAAVMCQLRAGQVHLLFDPRHGSCNIVDADTFSHLCQQGSVIDAL